jgi:hypothetical protein
MSFTPALLSPRFRQSVGTLVVRGKGGILSLNQDRNLNTQFTVSLTGCEQFNDTRKDESPEVVGQPVGIPKCLDRVVLLAQFLVGEQRVATSQPQDV